MLQNYSAANSVFHYGDKCSCTDLILNSLADLDLNLDLVKQRKQNLRNQVLKGMTVAFSSELMTMIPGCGRASTLQDAHNLGHCS